MTPEKAPAFQFYPKDFLMDGNVQSMSLTERGAYITLLCICWQEQVLPNDSLKLSRMVGLSLPVFQKIWPAVQRCFHLTPEGYQHRRLDVERAKQEQHRQRQSDKGRASAAARQPGGNRDSTTVQPDSNRDATLRSPISDLQNKEHRTFARGAPTSHDDLDPDIAERAGRFVERYAELYTEKRKGAKYLRRQPALDWDRACQLCRTWDDARLEKMAVIFLTTDDEWIAGTDRGFAVFCAKATWSDERLSAWEAQQKDRA